MFPLSHNPLPEISSALGLWYRRGTDEDNPADTTNQNNSSSYSTLRREASEEALYLNDSVNTGVGEGKGRSIKKK